LMSSDLVHSLVWPDMIIRLCQFHIIKAITQWAKSKPKAAKGKTKASKGKAKPTHHGLTDESWPKLLDLFRKAQRARSKESWKETYSRSFIKGVQELQREFGCNASVILEYFQQNWWNSWLGECTIQLLFCILNVSLEESTDIGLPADQTRDGPWNTNNYIESAFRVFDVVFLGLLQNKR
jgi:hypothetical protein